MLTLMQVFVSDPTDTVENNQEEGGEESVPPPSMRRVLPRADSAGDSETNIFRKVLKKAERLSERFIAGIMLLDIVSYSWKRHRFEAESTNLLHVSSAASIIVLNIDRVFSFYAISANLGHASQA